MDAYFGARFERLCREAMPLIYKREGAQVSFEVGEYCNKSAQIDVVGLRDDNRTDLGECKWGTVRALEGELAAKVSTFPNKRGANIGHRYFVHRMPHAPKREGHWHSVDDLYQLDP